jgi:nucleoside-diphosphate-sugar epimerase
VSAARPEGEAVPAPEAVVTGAAGWLGQNLVRALVGERSRVRCLVHRPEDGPLLQLLGREVEVVVGDIRDPAAVSRLFDGIGRATVFHAASVIHPAGSVRELFDVNVGGTEIVLDRARSNGAGRFLHVSSNSPFGANDRPTDRFTEDSPFNPYLGYGRSKLEAEQLVQRGHDRGDVSTVILRPPWFYGPHQPARQSTFFSAIRKGRFPVVGDGSQQRSMVFTGNLVDALLAAETAPSAPGQAYWIADAEPYELRQVVATVRRALEEEGLPVSGRGVNIPAMAGTVAAGVDAALQSQGRYVQPLHVLGELRDTIACDIGKARRELGWEPATELLGGMRASIRWCLDRGIQL